MNGEILTSYKNNNVKYVLTFDKKYIHDDRICRDLFSSTLKTDNLVHNLKTLIELVMRVKYLKEEEKC